MRYMRILLFSFLTTILVFHQVKAAGASTIGISTDKQSYQVGDTLTVVAKASNAVDFYGFQFKLSYDDSSLSFKKGTIKSSFFTTVGSTIGQGNISYVGILLGDVPGINGDVSLVSLQFDVIKDGNVSINMSNIKVSDSKSNIIQINTNANASIIIQKKPEQNTTPVSTPTPTPIPSPTPSTKKVEQPVVSIAAKDEIKENASVAETPAAPLEKPVTETAVQSSNTIESSDIPPKVEEQKPGLKPNEPAWIRTVIIIFIALIMLGDAGMIAAVRKVKLKSL